MGLKDDQELYEKKAKEHQGLADYFSGLAQGVREKIKAAARSASEAESPEPPAKSKK